MTTKMVLRAILGAMLLIPLTLIESVVRERAYRRIEAEHEIAQNWGTEQRILGPILVIPYERAEQGPANAYVLPRDLHVDARLEPQTRRRGIFEAVVYRARVAESTVVRRKAGRRRCFSLRRYS